MLWESKSLLSQTATIYRESIAWNFVNAFAGMSNLICRIKQTVAPCDGQWAYRAVLTFWLVYIHEGMCIIQVYITSSLTLSSDQLQYIGCTLQPGWLYIGLPCTFALLAWYIRNRANRMRISQHPLDHKRGPERSGVMIRSPILAGRECSLYHQIRWQMFEGRRLVIFGHGRQVKHE